MIAIKKKQLLAWADAYLVWVARYSLAKTRISQSKGNKILGS